jgi:hypothetical protein
MLASKKYDPLALTQEEVARRMEERNVIGTHYYSPLTHFGMFQIPPYLQRGIEGGRVLTDADPFKWEA